MKPQHKKKERVRQRMKPQGLTAKRKKAGRRILPQIRVSAPYGAAGLIYFLVFKYTPMYGLIIAFKNYRGAAGGLQGIFQADWVGLDNFITFFKSVYFTRVLRNTLLITFTALFSFPAPWLLRS